MKKILGIVAISALVLPAFAGIDGTELTYTQLCNSKPANVATTNSGSAVDVSTYQGNVKIVIFESGVIGLDTAATVTNLIEESSTGTSAWSTVAAVATTVVTTNASNLAMQSFNVDSDSLKKYIRLTSICAGTNGAHYTSGLVAGHKIDR
jgi:hypothetical protein